MKLAVANNLAGYPRFFNGGYRPALHDAGFVRPKTTAAPDRARVYTDRVVATLTAEFFNVLHGVKTGTLEKPWIVAELPEAWTS